MHGLDQLFGIFDRKNLVTVLRFSSDLISGILEEKKEVSKGLLNIVVLPEVVGDDYLLAVIIFRCPLRETFAGPHGFVGPCLGKQFRLNSHHIIISK